MTQHSNRSRARRKLKQSADWCDKIQRHLAEIAIIYEENPMRIREALEDCAGLVLMVQDILKTIRKAM